jgi:hypothetical protein
MFGIIGMYLDIVKTLSCLGSASVSDSTSEDQLVAGRIALGGTTACEVDSQIVLHPQPQPVRLSGRTRCAEGRSGPFVGADPSENSWS